MNKKVATIQTVSSLLFIFLFPVLAFSQVPFYQGKTITVISASAAGGVGELRERAVIRYLTKYIPGNPTIIMEFMPGGGGRKAANYMFLKARPDGLTIAGMSSAPVKNAVLKETGVEYEIDKFLYLGAPNTEVHYVFSTRREVGLNTLEKLRAKPGVRIGAQSVGHDIYVNGRLFAYLLDLKEPKFVTGYSGTELDLAVIRGEVDARTRIADSLLRRSPEWVEKGLADFHSIIEVPKGKKHTHPAFAQLPEVETFARTERERKLVDMYRTFRLVGSPFILPPGTPRDRVEILAEAMRRTFKDPGFFQDFKKLTGEDASPLMPEEQVKAIKELPRDPDVIDLFKRLSGSDPMPQR
ncbi:MAG: hypothetical protein HY695_00940 [Deltaproteobacteria bacterium]|nr:hypothetical protein [Deltaproteobacteria bacterium]